MKILSDIDFTEKEAFAALNPGMIYNGRYYRLSLISVNSMSPSHTVECLQSQALPFLLMFLISVNSLPDGCSLRCKNQVQETLFH